jgi:hypothetical protein
MEKELDLGFCVLSFFKHYMLAVINEGVNVSDDENEVLIQYAKDYYQDNPFVYITHRINSYSVNPNIYHRTAQVKSLVGFAVVSADYKAKLNAKIEKMFFKKPFEIFEDLDEAKAWADQVVKDHKNV